MISATIAVGFCSKTASMSRPIGWEPESWGYHGDDGQCMTAQGVGKYYGQPFGAGDVIGCGVNFREKTAFFTKNGARLSTPQAPTTHSSQRDPDLVTDKQDAFSNIKGTLYPAVSLKKAGEHVKVNFGQYPFIFDIDSYMRVSKWSARHL